MEWRGLYETYINALTWGCRNKTNLEERRLWDASVPQCFPSSQMNTFGLFLKPSWEVIKEKILIFIVYNVNLVIQYAQTTLRIRKVSTHARFPLRSKTCTSHQWRQQAENAFWNYRQTNWVCIIRDSQIRKEKTHLCVVILLNNFCQDMSVKIWGPFGLDHKSVIFICR